MSMIHSDGPDQDSEGDKATETKLSNTSKNALVEFNEKFQREANEYDKDILKRIDDLNTTLIFVSNSRLYPSTALPLT